MGLSVGHSVRLVRTVPALVCTSPCRYSASTGSQLKPCSCDFADPLRLLGSVHKATSGVVSLELVLKFLSPRLESYILYAGQYALGTKLTWSCRKGKGSIRKQIRSVTPQCESRISRSRGPRRATLREANTGPQHKIVYLGYLVRMNVSLS